MQNQITKAAFFKKFKTWLSEHGEVVVWFDYHSGLKYCDIYKSLDQLKQRIALREPYPCLTAIRQVVFLLQGKVDDAFMAKAKHDLVEDGSSYMLMQLEEDGVFTDVVWLDSKAEVNAEFEAFRGEVCAFGRFPEKGVMEEMELWLLDGEDVN